MDGFLAQMFNLIYRTYLINEKVPLLYMPYRPVNNGYILDITIHIGSCLKAFLQIQQLRQLWDLKWLIDKPKC